MTAVRINGSHMEAACKLYGDKSVKFASDANRLVSYSVVTFLAVVIPLVLSVKPGSDVYTALAYITVWITAVLWPNSMFLKLKSVEYNGKFKELMVRNIANHAYCSADNGARCDLDTFMGRFRDLITNHVMYATGMKQAEASELVGKAKGNAYCMNIYCERTIQQRITDYPQQHHD